MIIKRQDLQSQNYLGKGYTFKQIDLYIEPKIKHLIYTLKLIESMQKYFELILYANSRY